MILQRNLRQFIQKLQVLMCVCFFVLCVCVSLFYVIDTGSIGSRARCELGVTYLPFTVSSDAGYADLPLPLLGAPETWVTVSCEARPRLIKPPSRDRTTCTLSASSG